MLDFQKVPVAMRSTYSFLFEWLRDLINENFQPVQSSVPLTFNSVDCVGLHHVLHERG